MIINVTVKQDGNLYRFEGTIDTTSKDPSSVTVTFDPGGLVLFKGDPMKALAWVFNFLKKYL